MNRKYYTGTSDFKKIIEKGSLFIDKTLLIKDFINNNSEVTLIPRPRRFGKTLNMSMLTYFFDINDNSKELFKSFKIFKEEDCLKHMNQYPVISLSFKGSSTEDWEVSKEEIETIIAEEYKKHVAIKNILDRNELKDYELIENRKAPTSTLRRSILDLSKYLERKYKKKVIIIVDEYDAVMHKMYGNKSFNKCMDLFRGMYEYAFKGNPSLHKGLLTGILQVAKEGIFSGLNNVTVHTVLDERFSEHFGFLEEEIRPLIEEEGLSFEKAKEWYNGYKFGELTVYNPWSLINYLSERKEQAYWKNTGLGSIKLIMNSLKVHKGIVERELKQLIEGQEVVAEIAQGINLEDIERDEASFFSLLLYSGYLTYIKKIDISGYKVKIPNREVESFYKQILTNIRSEVTTENIIKYLIEGDAEKFEQKLNNTILKGTSYYDNYESFYHGIIYTMAKTLQGYEVLSNIESGRGRPDILLKNDKLGMVIELKKLEGENIDETKLKKELEKSAKKALSQIKEKRYYDRLERDNIKLVGIAFKEKRCKVVMENL